MTRNVLDWAMCIDCDWEGSPNECEKGSEYSEWHDRDFVYFICPECGGGTELTNAEHGDLN